MLDINRKYSHTTDKLHTPCKDMENLSTEYSKITKEKAYYPSLLGKNNKRKSLLIVETIEVRSDVHNILTCKIDPNNTNGRFQAISIVQ